MAKKKKKEKVKKVGRKNKNRTEQPAVTDSRQDTAEVANEVRSLLKRIEEREGLHISISTYASLNTSSRDRLAAVVHKLNQLLSEKREDDSLTQDTES